MSVSGIASTLSPFGTAPVLQPSRRQSEDQIGRQLEQALQNGDLNGAEQAYQQLAAFGPNHSGPFTDPTLKSEFQILGQDLQSGNLAAAQSDNSTLATGLLKRDIQAVIKNSNGADATDSNTALANLKGDYWAVYGQQMTNDQLQGLGAGGNGTTPISVQA
jgi:hypothetical protein